MMTIEQAKKIIAVVPKSSPYYEQARKVLFGQGVVVDKDVKSAKDVKE